MPDPFAELLHLSALEQAAAVRAREVSAVELLELYQGRIDRHESRLSAFTQRFRRRSLRRARAIDGALSRGQDPGGALLGVPFAVKDLDPVAFSRTRFGSKALSWVVTPVDSAQVKRLRALGTTFVGKTTTSELGLMPVVDTELQPPTVNPWNPGFLAGGSSGGAAAAVASGMLPVAHASDGGGSIRIPSALCHLFGFKASRELMPDFYGKMDPAGMISSGSVARTVADSAAVMDGLTGRPDAAGPGSLSEQLRRDPPKGLRIKLCVTSSVSPVEGEIADGVAALGRLLEEMGHHVEEVEGPSGSVEEFLPIYQRFAANPPLPTEAGLQPVTRWLRDAGKTIPVTLATHTAGRFEERVLRWMGDADLVLTPTTPHFAPPVGAYRTGDPEADFYEAARLGAFTAGINCSGQPAASLPIGVGGPDGLPFGAHLVGPRGGDALVLQLSRQLEEALDWNQRRSALFEA